MATYEGLVLFNYRLTRVLGEGGFGVVYEAVHAQLGRRAAVKILSPAFARHEDVVARFFQEAQAACAIGHPAIVGVTNVGRLDSGEPFIMMDHVAGRSLTALTAEDGPLPLAMVKDVFGPVASALTAAHAKGVVHRDLKPDNIMVALEGGAVKDVKLLDFGIAKLTDGAANRVSTRAGSVMGTPNFIAPEQARDAKSVDARADVYGFAATLYAALTGRPPFEAESLTALLLQVVTEPAPRLRAALPTAPAALDDVLDRCMAKHPDARPATIDAAWQSIVAALGPSRVVHAGPATPTVVAAPTAPIAPAAAPSPWPSEISASRPDAVTLTRPGGNVAPRAAAGTVVVRPASDHDGAADDDELTPRRHRRWGLAVLAAAGVAGAVVTAVASRGRGPAPLATTVAAALPVADAGAAVEQRPSPRADMERAAPREEAPAATPLADASTATTAATTPPASAAVTTHATTATAPHETTATTPPMPAREPAASPPPRPVAPPVPPGRAPAPMTAPRNAPTASATADGDAQPPCDAAALERNARDLAAAGLHVQALSASVSWLKCKPSYAGYKMAFFASCHAKNAKKAHEYFNKLTPTDQARLITICDLEHISPY